MQFKNIMFKLQCIDGIDDGQLLTASENQQALRDSQGISNFMKQSQEIRNELDSALIQFNNLKDYGKPLPETVYEYLNTVSNKILELYRETKELTEISFQMKQYVRNLKCDDTTYYECINEISSLHFDIRIRKIHLYWLSDKCMSISGECITLLQHKEGIRIDDMYCTPSMIDDTYEKIIHKYDGSDDDDDDGNYSGGIFSGCPGFGATGLFWVERCGCKSTDTEGFDSDTFCKGMNCRATIAYWKDIEKCNKRDARDEAEREYKNEQENKFREILKKHNSILPKDDMMNWIEYSAEDHNYDYTCPCCRRNRKIPPIKVKRSLFSKFKSILI